jgi:hypothetical protein
MAFVGYRQLFGKFEGDWQGMFWRSFGLALQEIAE